MISIIVTTYNHDHIFLKTALSSCLSQNIKKEIILIDDGSEIKINEYVKELIKKNNIKYIKHETNKGLSAARNTGISNCKYDFYITLDADDFFFDNTLSSLFQYVNSKSDIYFGNLFDGKISVPPGSRGITKNRFLQENQLWCSSLVRKKVWENIGGYLVREGPHYEDWNFWCRAYKHGYRFQYIPLCLYQHTFRQESMLGELHNYKDKYRRIATQDII